MKKYFKKLPPALKKIINSAQLVAAKTKMPAFLVGGCLRDLILGAKHCDLDITVEGDGILFAEKLAEKLKAKIIIHERFKTATLILPGDLKLDIATTRHETYPAPAALPLVSPGRLLDDLSRRDFTINALAANISLAAGEPIIDLFSCQNDLAAGRIRILHDLSFKDDPTRILRAVRFSQRFGFRIEAKTFRLLREAINQGLLDKVHPHRLRDELILILKESDPFGPLKVLSQLGALSFISPKLKVDQKTKSLFKSAKKELDWFVKNFPARRQLDRWLVYLALLLNPLSLPKIKLVSQRLGLRKGEQKRLVSYYQGRAKLNVALSKSKVLAQEVFSLLEPLSYETIMLLRATAKNKNLKKHLSDFFEVYNGMRLCVSGHDLGSLGILPGPQYQKIFAKVLAAKLNGQVKNRQAELALIRRLAFNR